MKSIFTKFLTLLGLTMLVSSMAFAQDPFGPADAGFGLPGEGGGNKAKAKIISSVTSAAPGKPFTVALEIEHPGEWHSYYKNAGGPSIPLDIKLTLPAGYTHSEILWPVPHVKWVYDVQNYIYEGNTYFLTTVTPAADATAGSAFTLKAEIGVQLCDKEGCQPPTSLSAEKTINIAAQETPDADAQKIISTAKLALPTSNNDVVFSAKQDAGNLLLSIKTSADLSKLSKPIFVANATYTDTEKKHVLTKQDGGYLLTVPLKEGKNIPATITGILTDESGSLSANVHGFLVNTKGSEGTPANSEAAPTKDEPKEEEIETSKYDESDVPNSKIALIDLSRLDDEGNVLDSDKKIVPVNEVFADIDRNLVDKDGNIRDKKTQTTFLLAALLIFAGGLILNLMPCVFPVLGVKVLGFVQLSGNDPAKIKKHGLVFTLGVLVSMWILAGAILAIKASTGDAIAWGSQMKSPFFVGSMAILLALFALNLFGVFEVGTSLTSAGGNLQSKKGYQGSFFSGILTTLIATPCGAPLLATAMTYTLQQTAFLAMILFTIFGLGVAFPYLVLSFLPKLIDKLPRPGGWMVTFKKSMAFPLFATVAFMLTVFIKQTGTSGITWMIWSLVTLSTAAFVYGTWSPPFTPKVKRYVVGFFLSIVIATFGGYMGYKAMTQKPAQAVAATSHDWTPWKPNLIEQTRKKGRIVWVDYTADW